MSRILIVVVRYRTLLEDSAVMQTLARCFAEDSTLAETYSTLVWDNSVELQAVPTLPFPLEYRHTGANVGVSGAYNYAMEQASQRGYSWLLLLDQDTTLPAGFLTGMRDYARRFEADGKIAAVAPTVLMGGIPVSPKITSRWGASVDPEPDFCGIVEREMIMMNSGLLLRVAALRQVGGYSMDFWLDFSDRYVCHMLSRQGFHAWLANDLRLEHHVSLMGGEGSTSPARYENLIGAQDAYFTLYKSLPRNVVFFLRLLRNALDERRVHPERTRLLRRHLVRRLTVPRKRRLEEWRQSVAAQRSGMAE